MAYLSNKENMESLLPSSSPPLSSLERAPGSQLSQNYGSEAPARVDKRMTWLILRRWKRTILLAAMLGVVAGLLVTALVRKRWEIRASLEVQDVNSDFLNTKSVTPNSPDTAASGYFSDIQTQIQIIQSDTILNRVVSELSAARAKRGQLDDQTAHEIDRIKKKIKARAMGQTRIIELSVVTADPQLGVDFLNLVCKDVINHNVTSRIEMSDAIGGWLTELLRKAQDRLRSSESVLEEYAKTHNLVFTSDNKSVAEENLRQIQDELGKVQALRAEKQSRYEASKSRPAASIPDVLNDSSLKQYEDQLTDLKRQRAELAAVYTPDYPKIKRLDAQIASLESALKNEEGDVLDRIQNEYQQAARRQALLTSQFEQLSRDMSDVNQRSIQYDILKHEVDSNRQLYDSMLQGVKQATIASAIHPSNIHVIDAAAIPKDYSFPKPVLSCAFGLVLFSFAAALFALLRERSDSTLKEPGDGAFLLSLPELGAVRHMPKRAAVTSLPSTQIGEKTEGKSLSRRVLGIRRRSQSTKQHAYEVAESFRSIATSILFSGVDGKNPRVVVVTSAGPGDGKTTLVANVGAALARSGRRVLLVDGDLRRNRLDEIFRLPNEFGLSTLLGSEVLAPKHIKAAVQPTSEPRLSVITGGPSSSDTVDLLYSRVLPNLVQQLKEEYDLILIDTPPLLEMPDARLLSRIADGVIFVARARRTTIDAALAASQRLSFDRARVLGMVLNDWNPQESLSGYYGYYGRKLA
jgi:polysaccharide biosynthesis transport protein